MTVLNEFFTGGDFWSILLKVLITTLLTAGIGYIGTLIGRIIAKSKNSRIYKYADTCVKAAEQKFPNEGKKMGPEKLQYVMDQMMIKFPKIRDNQYLYNIAEAAVFELNRQKQTEAAIKEFEEKYGEKPLAAPKDDLDEIEIELENKEKLEEQKLTTNTVSINIQTDVQKRQNKKQNKLQSF